ncbi:hypothetical protein [Streptomyces sp. 6-11-2]|uniref:hypothetical protein n=1 Tax=Streptomyces sp. 6-11-2 TaxID=2585753 RepID=UPI00209C5BE9|nr:hypothetical protein [Streptomyces sp. 6-11-2]
MAGFVETHRGRGGGTVVVHRPLKPGEGSLSFSREELRDALEFRRIVEPGRRIRRRRPPIRTRGGVRRGMALDLGMSAEVRSHPHQVDHG